MNAIGRRARSRSEVEDTRMESSREKKRKENSEGKRIMKALIALLIRTDHGRTHLRGVKAVKYFLKRQLKLPIHVDIRKSSASPLTPFYIQRLEERYL